jgi:hypothetical protein
VAARMTMKQHTDFCASNAAGTASMHFGAIVDTVIVAVSIFVVFLLGLS